MGRRPTQGDGNTGRDSSSLNTEPRPRGAVGFNRAVVSTAGAKRSGDNSARALIALLPYPGAFEIAGLHESHGSGIDVLTKRSGHLIRRERCDFGLQLTLPLERAAILLVGAKL